MDWKFHADVLKEFIKTGKVSKSEIDERMSSVK